MTYQPKPGDIVHLHGVACLPTYARIIRDTGKATYDGMVWLEIYTLNHDFQAVEKRIAYVPLANIRLVHSTTDQLAAQMRVIRRPANAGPVVPRPRRSPEPMTKGAGT